VVALRILSDLSADQTAEVLGISEHEVTGHLELETIRQTAVLTAAEPIDITELYGRTDASRVVVTREDGIDVVATVSGGAFVAWWPGENPPVALVAYDAQRLAMASQSIAPIDTLAPLDTPCICSIETHSGASGR
jgi:hypothetical protein